MKPFVSQWGLSCSHTYFHAVFSRQTFALSERFWILPKKLDRALDGINIIMLQHPSPAPFFPEISVESESLQAVSMGSLRASRGAPRWELETRLW
jgi:hypothetical protein